MRYISKKQPYNLLIIGILEQSIKDYKWAVDKTKQDSETTKNRKAQMKNNVERFFRSDYCDWLLECLLYRMKGTDILRWLERN